MFPLHKICHCHPAEHTACEVTELALYVRAFVSGFGPIVLGSDPGSVIPYPAI